MDIVLEIRSTEIWFNELKQYIVLKKIIDVIICIVVCLNKDNQIAMCSSLD